jgi:predicted AAA+ superfamily ATPase
LKLFFWRTQTGQEVDFLIERGREIVALEVKWGRRIEEGDIRNLQRCAEELKNRIRISAFLYGGSEVLALIPNIVAIPFSAFFEVTR